MEKLSREQKNTLFTQIKTLDPKGEIVSLTPLPEAYRYTQSIFRLYGKSGSIRNAASLGEALRVWEQ